MYGCQNHQVAQASKNGSLRGPLKQTINMHMEKIVPVLFAKSADWFSLNDCNFAVQKCKESTGRVSLNFFFTARFDILILFNSTFFEFS